MARSGLWMTPPSSPRSFPRDRNPAAAKDRQKTHRRRSQQSVQTQQAVELLIDKDIYPAGSLRLVLAQINHGSRPPQTRSRLVPALKNGLAPRIPVVFPFPAFRCEVNEESRQDELSERTKANSRSETRSGAAFIPDICLRPAR